MLAHATELHSPAKRLVGVYVLTYLPSAFIVHPRFIKLPPRELNVGCSLYNDIDRLG